MTLHVVSAGAAQAVVEQTIERWQGEGRVAVAVSYGAVGAQRKKILEGAPADVVLLTAAMIDELIASGHVRAGTRADLGPVVGGIAVRAGAELPDVSSPDALARTLAAAAAIYIPDPAIATAGAQFVAMCEKLAVAAAVRPKLRTFPNGFAAMTQLAADAVPGAIGCTQVTEIKWVQGVALVAPLPRALQQPTVYALGIGASCADVAAAQSFAERLSGAEAAPMLAAAGFGLSQGADR